MENTNKITATNSEVQKAVQETFTPEFNLALTKYSIYRILTRFNIKYDLNRGFRGIMVEDIISELMLSFIRFDSGRNWNKTQFPNFADQVYSSLDSCISNTIDKELSKTAQTNTSIEDCNITEENSSNYDEILDSSINYLSSLGASDDELLLFEPYIIHGMKRTDIASTFGISESEATNIKKKLDRKIPALREHIKNIKQ